tara:strand:- start:265 stop:483 length:219 start_codon:yes stop_codon:yes gene_type:complete
MKRQSRADLLAIIKDLCELAAGPACPDHGTIEDARKILAFEEEQQTRNERMMKGTSTATISETLCGNDPVNW